MAKPAYFNNIRHDSHAVFPWKGGILYGTSRQDRKSNKMQSAGDRLQPLISHV